MRVSSVDEVGRQIAEGDRDADGAVGLVDVGVCPEAGDVLRDPAHVTERRRPVVARLRVDAGQMDAHVPTLRACGLAVGRRGDDRACRP